MHTTKLTTGATPSAGASVLLASRVAGRRRPATA